MEQVSRMFVLTTACALLWIVCATVSAVEKEDRGGHRTLEKEVTVAASLDEVWAAWTTSEGIASFLPTRSNIELRIGGPYELYMGMKEPDASGRRGSEGCTILSFIPKEMLSFEWNFPPKVMHLRKAGAKTHVVLRFKDMGDGRVKVHFSQLGWQAGEDWNAGYAYFDKAWNRVLGRLVKRFEEGGVEPDDQRGVLRQDCIVDASAREIWKAFTTKEGLESWMAPHAEIDLRVGGKMLATYSPDGTLGDDSTIENTILSFEPNRMLSLKATKPPKGFPFADAIKDTWSVILLDEISPGRTRVEIVGLGYEEDAESQKMRAFFKRGNEWSLRELRKNFTKSDGDGQRPGA